MNEDIKSAVEILKKGGVILYPTDTIWGLGCDATREDAVKKIMEIKQRSDVKSMLVLLDSEEKLPRYVFEVPEIAWNILEVTDKPLTIIYPGAQNLAKGVIAEDGSVGIRITQDEFCCKLIRGLGRPVVSTSANISGLPWPVNFHQIDSQILKSVDYVVNYRQNEEYRGKPSGIIKLGVNGEVKVIRE
jgi:L-threonylcarbamoyladenylate synthase